MGGVSNWSVLSPLIDAKKMLVRENFYSIIKERSQCKAVDNAREEWIIKKTEQAESAKMCPVGVLKKLQLSVVNTNQYRLQL